MSQHVAICGALGKMGREAARTIRAADDLELGPMIDLSPGEVEGKTVFGDLPSALRDEHADVCVDLTHPKAAVANSQYFLERGIPVVIGTSGIGELEQAILSQACLKSGTPALVVPNFAIGAILMMRFAEMAAEWMPNVEIIEMHHAGKADAPSGTAMHTAARISKGRNGRTPITRERILKAEGALGAMVDGVPIHSVRLPGLVAHQKVIFGSGGETLTIHHDSIDRSSFMPGLLLAIRKVPTLKGLSVGLEPLMFEPPLS